jgi:phage shock protein A
LSATARLLGWCVACGLTLSVSSVPASPNWMTSGTQVCRVALGQSGQSDSAESRRAADNWLRQAREAIKSGNLEVAEYCVERAEKLNVKYDPLFARFKDTPEKVRKDLNALRADSGVTPSASEPRFPRLFNRDAERDQPPVDPYGGPASEPIPDAAAGGGVPPQGATAMSGSPETGDGVGTKADHERHQRSRELLLAARQALAKGDMQRASLLVGQANKLGLVYPDHADSPEHVASIVNRATGFTQGPAAGTDPGVYTREFAQFLLDQATGLLAYQAFDAAQQLAQQAQDLRAQYGQFDRTPDQVLTQIAAARRRVNAELAGTAAGTETATLAESGGNPPRRLPAAGEDWADPKSEALRLIAQARAALDRGDLAAAQQMAEQAQDLVPESAYGPNEPRPWMVLLEVNKALNRRNSGVVPASHFDSQHAVATDAQHWRGLSRGSRHL